MTMPRQKILITGATGGLGRELVLALSLHHDVVFTYHSNAQKAQTLEQEVLKLHGQKIKGLALDLGSSSAIAQLIDMLDNDFNILINNGAIGSGTVLAQAKNKHDQDLRLMQVNALGPLWLSEMFLQKMSPQRQRTIINISSVGGGIFHYPGFRLADGMSKAAMTFMARQMAAEHCRDGVSIITFCPGAMDTPMLQASTLNKMTAAERQSFERSLPQQKMVSPKTLAGHIANILMTGPEIFHGAVIDCSQGLGVNPSLLGK